VVRRVGKLAGQPRRTLGALEKSIDPFFVPRQVGTGAEDGSRHAVACSGAVVGRVGSEDAAGHRKQHVGSVRAKDAPGIQLGTKAQAQLRSRHPVEQPRFEPGQTFADVAQTDPVESAQLAQLPATDRLEHGQLARCETERLRLLGRFGDTPEKRQRLVRRQVVTTGQCGATVFGYHLDPVTGHGVDRGALRLTAADEDVT